MKKKYSFGVIACATVLLASAVLSACQSGNAPHDDTDPETVTAEVTVDTEEVKAPMKPYKDFTESQPYRITYTAEEGEEGCTAVIEYHPYYEEPFVLEIPDQSPDGKPVTKVTSNPLADLLPHYMLAEDFAVIQEAAEAYFGVTYEDAQKYRMQSSHPLARPSFYLCRFMSYFTPQSRADLAARPFDSEEQRELALEDMLTAYPITATGARVYVLSGGTTDTEKVSTLVRTILEAAPNGFDGLCYESLMKMKTICEEASIDDPNVTALLESYSGRGKGVTDIVWPASLKGIDGCSFLGCTSLSRVTVPGTVQAEGSLQQPNEWESYWAWEGEIGEYAFAFCTAMEEITFSEGVAYIGNKVLHGNMKLARINLPASLQGIGTVVYPVNPFDDPAFDGSTLPDIHFNGTLAQWAEVNTRIDVNGYNTVDYADYVYFTVHCTDGVMEAKEYKK